MHLYEILPIFRLTNGALPISADTDYLSDVNILLHKSADNRHHYAMKLSL